MALSVAFIYLNYGIILLCVCFCYVLLILCVHFKGGVPWCVMACV